MRSLVICVFVLLPTLIRAQSATSAPIFRITTDEFWLNLHHFLTSWGAPRRRQATRHATRWPVRHPKPSEA